MATIPASENEFPEVLFSEGAAPAAPAAGLVKAYAKSDGLLYSKDDAGAETALGAAAHIADTTDAHDASAISVDPTGLTVVAGTDVQTAIEELDAGIAAGGIPASIIDAAGDLIIGSAADTAARLARGTNGQALLATSTTVAFGDVTPWTIQLLPFLRKSTTGFGLSSNDDTIVLGIMGQSSGTQNDEIVWDIVLGAGTWTFSLLHHKSTNRGIYSVQLDTVEQGTIDGYSGSASINQTGTVTDISVSTTGKKEFKLKMSTKNASSSSYFGAFSMCMWHRTA